MPVTAETNFFPTWLCQKTASRETLTGAAVLAVATLILTPLGTIGAAILRIGTMRRKKNCAQTKGTESVRFL
jgi:hypothetical protein